MTIITATASNPTPSSTGVAGWDCDVQIEINGRTLDGEVTLLPSEQDGRPAAWGSSAHWCDGRLLAALRGDERSDALAALAERWIDGRLLGELRALDHETFRAACNAIESAAREAIEASGVEPAAACAACAETGRALGTTAQGERMCSRCMREELDSERDDTDWVAPPSDWQ